MSAWKYLLIGIAIGWFTCGFVWAILVLQAGNSKVVDSLSDMEGVKEVEAVTVKDSEVIANVIKDSGIKEKVIVKTLIPEGYIKFDLSEYQKVILELNEARESLSSYKAEVEKLKKENYKDDKRYQLGLRRLTNLESKIKELEDSLLSTVVFKIQNRGLSFKPIFVGGYSGESDFGIGLKLYYYKSLGGNIFVTTRMMGIGGGFNLGYVRPWLRNTQLIGGVGIGGKMEYRYFVGLSWEF